MECTLTIGTDRLPVRELNGSVAILASPATQDYPAGKASLCQTCDLFSKLCCKSIGPVRAGDVEIVLSEYEGDNYFEDCLGDKWRHLVKRRD